MALKKPFIGQMDRLVDIVRKAKSQTVTGSQISTEELVCRYWAFLEEKSGDEEVEGKVMHVSDRDYTIRFNSDVKKNGKDYVLIDDGKRYEIRDINEIGRKGFLKLNVSLYE